MEHQHCDILIVDDRQPNALLLEEMVQQEGIKIDVAYSGREALQYVEQREYALILLDVKMPGMDGFETASHIRALRFGTYTPILFVTDSCTEQENIDKGYAVGAADYMTKPLKKVVVRNRVAAFVTQFRLRKQSEVHVQAMQSSMDGISILDKAYCMNYINPAFAHIFCTADCGQLEGKTFSMLLNKESQQAFVDRVMPTLRNERKWHGVLWGQYQCTDPFPLETSLSLIDDGRVVCVLRDISERIASEEEVKRLASVVENAYEMVMITDASLQNGPKISYVNKALTQISGYEKEELLGKTPQMIQGKNTSKKSIARLWKAMQKGEHYQDTLLCYAKDKTPYWNEINVMPIHNDEGVVTHFTSTQRDVTQERKEREMMEYNQAQLQEMVEHRTEDLRKAKDMAEQANAHKDEFIANMSHELRTPMHAILSFSEIGMRYQTSDEHKKTKEHDYFHMIHESGSRLLKLINNLLDMSKLEMRDVVLDLRYSNLSIIVGKIAMEMSSLLEEKSLKLHIKEPEFFTGFYFDVDQVTQVVSNILGNAIKFSPEGGTITLSFGDQMDHVTDSGEGMVYLSVKDEGCGIPEQELEVVFDKFQQSSMTKTGAGGTGLGLAISRRIIQAHGGSVQAKNNKGKGCIFTITLPAKQVLHESTQPTHEKKQATPAASVTVQAVKSASVQDHVRDISATG